MQPSELDNVVWHALHGAQRQFAEFVPTLVWYPAAIAPFIAVSHPDIVPDLDGAWRHGFRHPAYFAGVLPHALPPGWHYASHSRVLQLLPAGDESMTATATAPASVHQDMRLLGPADRPAMLQLARAAFPDFFRERTAELGTYLGIFTGAELVAMAGERMALEGMREISGVCTHPQHVGRGFARRLTGALLEAHRRRGLTSFLHVGDTNTVARNLYESMGLIVRASLRLGKVERE
jgi:ribosomal protein S18 acetylase RimI-like enzyme